MADNHIEIQLRRTNLDIGNSDNRNTVNATGLKFGEPLLLNNEGYLVIGNGDGTTLNTDLLKFKPFDDDIVEKQVFFNDTQRGTVVNKYIEDENGNTIKPHTISGNVTYGASSNVESELDTINAKTATLVANGKYAASLNPGGNAILADAAVKLQTARNIEISGSVTGTASFDGTSNINISTTTNHTHSYAGSDSVGGAANTLKVTNVPSASTDKVYVLGTTGTGGQSVLRAYSPSGSAGTGVYFKGSTGVLYGAAWNDFAEYRKCGDIEPGRVVVENGDGTMSMSCKRLQKGASVVSDTFGMVIGKQEEGYEPIAVAGRVLVYAHERLSLEPGDPVCASTFGCVSKMTRLEAILHPECIVGYVSEIPDYALWNEKVVVDNRIWIKVK